MKFEHILNMEYSLRDAEFLFWLIKEKGIPLPLLGYDSDYKFFDTHNYFLALNEPTMINQQKKRLQGHLEKAMYIREMANYSDVGTDNIVLYGSFYKSLHADTFYFVEKGFIGKRVSFRCSTYFLEVNLETSKPNWVVTGESFHNEREWRNLWDEYEIKFAEKYQKSFSLNQITTVDIFGRLCEIINELNLLLDIKEEHPHKIIIDSLIPKHINEIHREELEHIFSNGKYNVEQVKWLSGYKELQEYLYPHYDNGIIPHQHSQNWYDFAIKNFTQKNGNPLKLKSLQNAFTRQNWENNSRNSQNNVPNPSRTVPETFPNVSVKVQVDVTNN